MNLVKDVLTEMDYRAQSEFLVTVEDLPNLHIVPFISVQNRSQVYLVVTIAKNDLHIVLSEQFLPAVAESFRNQRYYVADMAKNTSLLIMSPCAERNGCSSEDKLRIEDDPYFFKKYVFSYTEVEEKKVQEYVAQQREDRGYDFCYVSFIQEYILNKNYFTQYKKQFENEPIYTYLVELCAKLPILPLPTSNVHTMKNATQFLEEKIEEMEMRKKDPFHIKKAELDYLLTQISDWKQARTETIAELWREICESSEEGSDI